MSEQPPIVEDDSFEVGFRLLGNEIIGFHLKSRSKTKSGVFFGILILIAGTFMISKLGPILIELSRSIG